MMFKYDKELIKEQLTIENYFELLEEWGGNPQYTNFGLTCETICHNPPGIGSRKLYWYSNSQLFRCYTGCENPSFDIYELVIKVQSIQHHLDFTLYEAIKWIAQRFGIITNYTYEEKEILEDWTILKNYDRIQGIEANTNRAILKEYDSYILNKFNYNVVINPWLQENISQEAMDKADIGFYIGGNQITIPHYDINNRLIGLRGRTLIQEEAELYGKYRPLKINNILYSHPLGLNLYGINWAKDNIKAFKKAVVFESEKSVLSYMSYMGIDNSIAVACCGSSFSAHQFQLLKDCGAEEIIIGFDKDFKTIGDDIFNRQTKNLTNIHNRYSPSMKISFLFDKENNLLPQKASPIEMGKEIFMKMFKERIML